MRYNPSDRRILANRHFFGSGEHKISVIEPSGTLISEITVYDYLKKQASPQSNDSSISLSKNVQASFDRDIIMDGALRCEDDNDFSCSQWNLDRDVARLSRQLAELQIDIPITQAWIDGNNNALNLALTLVLAVPSAQLGKLVVFSSNKLADLIVTHLTAGGSWVLANEITALLSDGIKAGDIITLQGGKIIKITRTQEGSASNGGTGDGEAITIVVLMGELGMIM